MTLRKSLDDFAISIDHRLIQDGRKTKAPGFIKLFKSAVFQAVQRRKFVLLIDNIEETNVEVISLLDTLQNSNVFVIVTSRDITVMDFDGERLHLEPMLDDDAVLLLQSSLDNISLHEAKQLGHLLQNFPLALQQAVAYIRERRITSLKGVRFSVADYIRQFEKQRAKLLDSQLSRLEHSFRSTTMLVWNTSIAKLATYGPRGEVRGAVNK